MHSRNGHLVFRFRNAAMRWAVCGTVVVVALAGAVISMRWAAAETLLYFARRGPVPLTALEHAKSFEPSNPETSYLLGVYYLDVEVPPNLALAEAHLSESLALGPNRSDTWLALGRLHEAAGDANTAESAFRRAAALAPSHWKPAWMLGNLYVRQGRFVEAVEPFDRVIAANPSMASLAIRTLWLASTKDYAFTSSLAARTAAGEGAFVDLLLSEGRTEEAMRVWHAAVERFPSERGLVAKGRQLAAAALEAGRGDEFAGIWSTLGEEVGFDIVANATFEEPIPERAATPFAWAVSQARDARVGLGAGRDGGRALRIDYESKGGDTFTHASQLIRVRPGGQYELLFWSKSDDLVSGSPPAVAVSDVVAKSAVGSASLEGGTGEWAAHRVTFTGPASGFVRVTIGRTSCGAVCPIFGAVLFDDFELRTVARG